MRTAKVYVADVFTEMGLNKFKSKSAYFNDRVATWRFGETHRQGENKDELVKFIEKLPLKDLDRFEKEAKKILKLHDFQLVSRHIRRLRGKAMETKLNLKDREQLLTRDICTKKGVKFFFSVRADSIEEDRVVEVKTRSRACRSIIYPNERVQCQIYMELADKDICEFRELTKKEGGGYTEEKIIIKRSLLEWCKIECALESMTDRLAPLIAAD